MLTLVGTWLIFVALGVAAIVYGGMDDSPGLQLIGVLIVLGATALVGRRLWRAAR
jgi:hypothetical protein